ncbi:MAG TPA: type IV pilus biogenesis/stability protein PilW [Methylococcaceae bacterium]|nr:type IV pilus biogenesis/stability protein PilW [Methylococcaceae bacterium]
MTLFRRWGLALLALLAACSSDGPSRAEENAKASDVFTRKGVRYMEDGRLDLALQDFERALDFDSGNSEAHNAMAVLQERLNKPDEARKHYKRAVSLNEANYAAVNNYSKFLCLHGEQEEGVQLLLGVLNSNLYGHPWVAQTNLGICYKTAGRMAEAEQAFRQAIDQQPAFSPALLEMAQVSFASQDYMKARAFLQRYTVGTPHNAETLWLAVRIEEALGNERSRHDYLQQLHSRFPNAPETDLSRQQFPGK